MARAETEPSGVKQPPQPTRASMWGRMQQIPRYYIYLLLAAVVAWQILFPIRLPIVPGSATTGLYRAIEKAPADKLIVISADWDSSTQAETGPQTSAIIEACFQNHKRFALLTLSPPMGAKLSNDLALAAAQRHHALYGVDWVNWGYKFGGSNVLMTMVRDVRKAMGEDFYGKPVSSLPIMRTVRTIKDIGLVVEVTGLAGMTEAWVGLIQGPYGVPFSAGYTAVMAPGYYPFLDSGQLKGMLVGAKGAAELEALVKRPGTATDIMSVQSWVHILIMLLIVLGNVGYVLALRHGKERMS